MFGIRVYVIMICCTHILMYMLFLQALASRFASMGIYDQLDNRGRGPQVVAMSCKMVGGGSDGSLDLCARVCLIDENENIIFHSYMKPLLPVTNYRPVIISSLYEYVYM